jgi:DNA (cytosine-5)-methyltransferase 1
VKLVAPPSGFGSYEVGDVSGTLRQTLHKGEASTPLAFNWQTGTDQLSPRTTHTDALHAGQSPAVAFSAGNSGDSFGIGYSEEHTPPLRAGESGTNQVPTIAGSAVRRLTPLESERLQGFPDGWTDIPGNSDTQRYRQLGNAVAVPVVEWLLGNIAVREENP